MNPKLRALLLEERARITWEIEAIDRLIGLYEPSKEESKEEIAVRDSAEDALRAVQSIEWITVPKGEFLFTVPKGEVLYGAEKRVLRLPEFRISRYSVTVEQFRPFVEGDGYEDEEYWNFSAESLAWRKKTTDDPKQLLESQSVRGVTWYEAMAYCRWLGKRLGMEIRLPTEEEWEMAARHGLGGDGIELPGNVWEWTYSRCADTVDPESPKYLTREDDWVLRGGSFGYDSSLVPCSARHWTRPSTDWSNLRFRVSAPSKPPAENPAENSKI